MRKLGHKILYNKKKRDQSPQIEKSWETYSPPLCNFLDPSLIYISLIEKAHFLTRFSWNPLLWRAWLHKKKRLIGLEFFLTQLIFGFPDCLENGMPNHYQTLLIMGRKAPIKIENKTERPDRSTMTTTNHMKTRYHSCAENSQNKQMFACLMLC